MTIGIYSLYWKDQDLIYIGQSVDIEARFKKHLRNLLINKHSNYKVQDAYNKYGEPILQVIEECSSKQLNELERVWQKEFNSLGSLDLVDAGLGVGSGTDNGFSKYSKDIIIETLKMLTNPDNSLQYIADTLVVTKPFVASISGGYNHKWLQEEFPELYSEMNRVKNLKTRTSGSIKDRLGFSPILTNGKDIVEVNNISHFSKLYGLDGSAIARVIKGTAKTHKGWKLK